jgi:hypothetical protein
MMGKKERKQIAVNFETYCLCIRVQHVAEKANEKEDIEERETSNGRRNESRMKKQRV